jgi:hypothetical protein
MSGMRRWLMVAIAVAATAGGARGDDPWLTIHGGDGPGRGKKVVLVSGDEEYRSEEALPQLAKILAKRHGFDCTVLFAIDKSDGTINPEERGNIPGLRALRDADLLILFTRFRDLPDDQMMELADYIESGRPIIALRTATHAFDLTKSPTYRRYTWNGTDPEGGFGRLVLGETWVNHHGNHGTQSTRGLIAPGMTDHPITRGITDGDIWGPTDVYGVRLPLPGDSRPVVLGQVLQGMSADDPPLAGEKNDPMMPVAWIRTYTGAAGKPARVFATTMGASQDLASEGLRRLLVNATYWALGLEEQIPAKADVAIVGTYDPSPFKFGGHRRGIRPADLADH